MHNFLVLPRLVLGVLFVLFCLRKFFVPKGIYGRLRAIANKTVRAEGHACQERKDFRIFLQVSVGGSELPFISPLRALWKCMKL